MGRVNQRKSRKKVIFFPPDIEKGYDQIKKELGIGKYTDIQRFLLKLWKENKKDKDERKSFRV